MTDFAMTPYSRVIRRRDLPSAELGPMIHAVMNDRRDHYFALRDTSAAIWDLLAEELTVADLCARLCERFNVSAENCQKDTLEFLEELRREGLVEVREEL